MWDQASWRANWNDRIWERLVGTSFCKEYIWSSSHSQSKEDGYGHMRKHAARERNLVMRACAGKTKSRSASIAIPR